MWSPDGWMIPRQVRLNDIRRSPATVKQDVLGFCMTRPQPVMQCVRDSCIAPFPLPSLAEGTFPVRSSCVSAGHSCHQDGDTCAHALPARGRNNAERPSFCIDMNALRQAQVVVASCSAAAILEPLAREVSGYDYIIMDEAAQVTPPPPLSPAYPQTSPAMSPCGHRWWEFMLV